MRFHDVLQLKKNDIVSLVGAGGKTSIMYLMGAEARDQGLKAVLTTTTKVYYPNDQRISVLITDDLSKKLHIYFWKMAQLHLFVGSGISAGNKVLGFEKDQIINFLDFGADVVIVEADGAANKPFKAPAFHEPVIPPSTTHVIAVVGIDCIGKPLNSGHCHRPEIISEIACIAYNGIITPEVVAEVMTHPLGFKKSVPPEANWTLYINKVNSSVDLQMARRIASDVMNKASGTIMIGSTRANEPILEVYDNDSSNRFSRRNIK